MPCRTAADLFERVHGWLVGYGTAWGRGGHPGGRDRPGWAEHARHQCRMLDIVEALTQAFGEPPAGLAESLAAYARSFPPPVRLLGGGYGSVVDAVAGRLVYSIPVDSGFMGRSFSFSITQADLDVLRTDPDRRAALEVVARAVLQRSMLPGSPEVTELAFGEITAGVLHTTPEALETSLAGVEREYRLGVGHFFRETTERHAASGP